jgi:hypothetical protein
LADKAPLSAVANQEKLLPPDFIGADGFNITEAARRYLAHSSPVKPIHRLRMAYPTT